MSLVLSKEVPAAKGSSFFEALVLVKTNSRARRILQALSKTRRMYTAQLLRGALGRINNYDHDLLKRLEAHGLIRRYEGHLYEDERGPRVVWNELTPLGRRVLELLETMDGE